MKIGDRAPDFTLPSQSGRLITLYDLLQRSHVVLYFYPKNHTFFCIKESCSFRDSYTRFKEAGAEVVGISSDPVSSHEDFADKYHLPFILLSDSGRAVRKAFGVPTHLFGLMPGRVTYVIDKAGFIRHIFDSKFDVEGHISQSLAVLNKL